MVALDVSGSMTHPLNRLPLSCRDASAALALVTTRTEKIWMVTAFSSGTIDSMNTNWRNGIGALSLSPRERLDDVIRKISGMPFGGTDCALPMLYAIEKRIKVDAFVIYTDNETWAGEIHPSQALTQYQKKFGINAKLITVGMTSNGFSIADPERNDMLDIVGFDIVTPQVISNFIVQ
jgi:60 kDa SS-A/Ro ribonucleoprotein